MSCFRFVILAHQRQKPHVRVNILIDTSTHRLAVDIVFRSQKAAIIHHSFVRGTLTVSSDGLVRDYREPLSRRVHQGTNCCQEHVDLAALDGNVDCWIGSGRDIVHARQRRRPEGCWRHRGIPLLRCGRRGAYGGFGCWRRAFCSRCRWTVGLPLRDGCRHGGIRPICLAVEESRC